MNWIDPSTWFPAVLTAVNQTMIDLAMILVNALQGMLINPPRLDDYDFVKVLYGNSIGILPLLAFFTSFTLFMLSLALQKKFRNALQAVLIGVTALLLMPFWFEFAYSIIDWGTELTKSAAFFLPPSTSPALFDLPTLLSLPLSAVMAIYLAFWSAVLWFVLLLYGVLNISMIFWFVPAVTLYSLGDGFAKVVKIMVSVMIVSMFIGRPVARFIISLSKGIAGLPGFNTALPTYGLLIGGVILAIAIQPVLVFLSYKGVGNVIGRFAGSSLVRGSVETENKETLDVNVQKFNDEYAQSMRGGDAASVATPQHELTRMESVILEKKQEYVQKGAMALSALATSNGVGALGVGVINNAGSIVTARMEDKAMSKSIDRAQRRRRNV